VATTPLVPEAHTKPIQDAIDSPSLERSPMEARLRGWHAGTIEGLRSLTSPIDIIAGLSGTGALRSASAISRGASDASALGRMAGPTMDLIESPAVRQVAPAADEVTSLIGDMQRNLAKVPKPKAPPVSTLGEAAAEFAPVGGEAAYNAGRGASNAGSSASGLYEELLRRMGGRGPG
jgi:hypothetical protein